MLNKVSSAKYMTHSNLQSPPNITNWESLRKDMLSTRQITNNYNSDTSNINNRLMQLFKLIEQERIERQKDFQTLNDKIKLTKCKHQLVAVEGKEKTIKNSSTTFIKTVQSLNNQNQFNIKRGYDINQYSQCKLMKEDQHVKLCIKDLKSENQVVKEKQEMLEERMKQLYRQAELRHKQYLSKQNLTEQETCSLNKHLQLISKQYKQLKDKVEEKIEKINNKILDDAQKNKKQVETNVREKLLQLQQNFTENLKQMQERNMKQLGALGEIVDKNLQLMHKTIHHELTDIMQNKLQQYYQTIKNMDIIQEILHEQENIRKLSETTQFNMYQHNEKIIQQFQLISQNLSSLQQKYQLLAKRELQNSKIFLKTQQSLPSNSYLDGNPSIMINNLSEKNDDREIIPTGEVKHEVIEERLKKIHENFDKKLSDILELVAQNCTFLETRNVIIEQSVADVVHVISDLLIKFKKYI